MVGLVRYLTHPQVDVAPGVPVPQWGLSAAGRARVASLAASHGLQGTTLVVSSTERKAVETAAPLAAGLGVPHDTRPAMHENDRSATGFLPPEEFEAMADRFFARPLDSVRGWERAIDAQTRIVTEVDAVLAAAPMGDILIVGHGAVGTLLYCHLAGMPIDRRHDQPAGGGAYFTADRGSRRPLHGWRPMEALISSSPIQIF